jgi:hypothetical protein
MKKYSQLADLESLLLIIPDANIRIYAEESVNAYYSGAYRSAVVSIWIAIVLDIYYKVRYLAEQYRDPAAIQCIKDIEKIRRDANLGTVATWEREILDKAYNDIKMFTKIEFEDIDRIQKDRHRCAHPVMNSDELLFQPTPELVRHYIRIAIEIVLSQPPTIGKALIAAIENDVQTTYFPGEIDDVIKFLQGRHLKQSEKYKINLLKFCLKKILYLQENSDSYLITITRYILVFVAIYREYPNIIESTDVQSISKIIDSTIEDRYNFFGKLIFEYKVLILWELASDQFKVKFSEYVNKQDEQLNILILQIISNSIINIQNFSEKYSKLDFIQKKQVLLMLFKENVQRQNQYKELCSHIINHNITCLTTSGSFSTAKSSVENLIEPIFEYLTKDHIIKILLESIERQNKSINQIKADCERSYIKLFEYSRSKYPEILSNWETFIGSADFSSWKNLKNLINPNQDIEF